MREEQWQYTREGMIEVARVLRAYLFWKEKSPKTPLTTTWIDLAIALVGRTLTRDNKWRTGYRVDVMERRIRSAGYDPKTWEVIDPKAAAWSWYQIMSTPPKKTRRYSEKRQAQLIASGEEPPDLDIPLILETNQQLRKRVLEQKQQQNINQDLGRRLREHFE